MKKSLMLVALLALPSCASIVEGTSQDIAVNSNPECASCTITREGEVIARISCTPETVSVKKRKQDLQVSCTKEGYTETKQILESGTEGFVAGNILAGGIVGWGIDSATGADNKYPEQVIINMVKE